MPGEMAQRITAAKQMTWEQLFDRMVALEHELQYYREGFTMKNFMKKYCKKCNECDNFNECSGDFEKELMKLDDDARHAAIMAFKYSLSQMASDDDESEDEPVEVIAGVEGPFTPMEALKHLLGVVANQIEVKEEPRKPKKSVRPFRERLERIQKDLSAAAKEAIKELNEENKKEKEEPVAEAVRPPHSLFDFFREARKVARDRENKQVYSEFVRRGVEDKIYEAESGIEDLNPMTWPKQYSHYTTCVFGIRVAKDGKVDYNDIFRMAVADYVDELANSCLPK